MKKLSFFILLIFLLLKNDKYFASEFEKVGEYERFRKDDGSFASSEFVTHQGKKYYINENGYKNVKSWLIIDGHYYYSDLNGEIYEDGKYFIDDNYFYFDKEGRLMKGWIDGIYYANEDGCLVDGFQELEMLDEWRIGDKKDMYDAWFYFNPQTKKKLYAEGDEFICRSIGTSKYCFDQDGVMCTGWKLIKDTTPVMKGYMFFAEESTDKFNYGEALYNTWFATEPPVDVIPNGEVKYFSFMSNGMLRCANSEDGLQIYRIDTKSFLFNEYGYALYGIRKVGNDYYYFGPNDNNCSMKTGLINLINSAGEEINYYFEDNGKGYSGVYKNKLYYKGRLQKAAPFIKYASFKVNGGERLVNSAGVVMKNKKKIKDGNGVVWSSDENGYVTYTEDGIPDELLLPEVED